MKEETFLGKQQEKNELRILYTNFPSKIYLGLNEGRFSKVEDPMREESRRA